MLEFNDKAFIINTNKSLNQMILSNNDARVDIPPMIIHLKSY